jgi:hypothetical protein
MAHVPGRASWRCSAGRWGAPASASSGSTPTRRRCSWATSARWRWAGAIGFVALATKTELALPIIGGVFVAEAVSDIIQVAYYKKTKKRIFLMAPIHHHFEKLGWPESRIVVRFWIVSFACAILGLITTLKVR